MSGFVRSFKYYLELLPEIRSVVIDEMCPDDRCRFTRTSKLSKKEARASKKFIESIEFIICSAKYMRIFVSHSDSQLYRNCSYSLNFKNDGVRQFMTLNSNWNQDDSWFALSNSKNLIEHAYERLKKLMQSYQNLISKLCIESKIRGSLNNQSLVFDPEISEMSNLKELTIDGYFNSTQYLSKIKLPLKKLSISQDRIVELPMEKVYQVWGTLSIPELRLNNERFLQLSASEISIHVGELTPEDVYNFIQAWQRGEIGSKLRLLNLNSRDSFATFKVEQVFRLLGDNEWSLWNALDYKLVLKHHVSAGRTATLSGHPFALQIIFENGNIDG